MSSKTSRKRLILLGVALICGCGLLVLSFFLSISREPVYDGKSVTEWYSLVLKRELDAKQMEVVFGQLGPKAIPYIFANSQTSTDTFSTKYHALWVALPSMLRKWFPSPQGGEDDVADMAEAIGSIGPSAIQPLLKWESASNPSFREACVNALGVFHRRGHTSAQVIPALIRRLQDKDAMVRWRAARVLSRFGQHAQQALPSLIVTLDDGELGRTLGETIWVRAAAVDALGEMGVHANEAIPKLTELTQDSDAHTAFRSLVALRKIGWHPTNVVASMMKMWRSVPSEQKIYGIRMLSEIGHPEALDGLPILLDGLSSPDESIRRLSTNVIQKLVPEKLP